MLPVPGGDWTAASLYNHQVGLPLFFAGFERNRAFKRITDVKLIGLGHVLKKSGYGRRYIIGKKDFAGMADLLTAYGMPVVSEENSIGVYEEALWGLHDYDLFKEAKLQIQELKNDKPFALFLSTINTHFPNGVYDKRMESFVAQRKNNLEFSVSAVDYLINGFIEYLKKENVYDDTATFIFPDHLLMGHGEIVTQLKKYQREMYLITNVNEKKLSKKNPIAFIK